MDPQRTALETVDGLLSKARSAGVSAADCLRLVELAPMVPGRARAITQALAQQGDAPAVDALLLLPPSIPGLVEGLFRALNSGVSRRRLDATSAPRLLAIEFRHSRAQAFPQILARAHAVFGDGLERFDLRGTTVYRVGLTQGRGTLAGRASAISQDLSWLHGRLARLKGTRLWLNGWCFPCDGAFGASVQVHLIRGFMQWAGQQTSPSAGRRGPS